MDNRVMEKLKCSRLFANISDGEIPLVLKCVNATERSYRKSEFIFLEGQTLKQVGFLLEGSVQMIKEDYWGDKMILTTFSAGDIFGESFVCNDRIQSTVSFQASGDSRILFLPFHRLFKSCARACLFHQTLIENMVVTIAAKNVTIMEKMEIISKKTIRERLLVWMSQQIQQKGSKSFVSPMRRLELADYLCVDRSALTRELSNMKRDGLIDFEKDRFELM